MRPRVTVTLDAVEGLGTFAEVEILTEEDAEDAAQRIGAIVERLGVEGPPIYVSHWRCSSAESPPAG